MAPYDIPSRGRQVTKKALLVGIGYCNERGREGRKLESIPTSIPNVQKFKEFLQGECPLSSPTIPNLNNPFMPSRLLGIHGHHCNDGREPNPQETPTDKEQFGSPLPSIMAKIHIS
jgi:hypothetical protein